MVDLDAVEALANAATPGPWFDMGDIDVYVGEVRCAEPYTAVCRDPELDDRPGDRAFIAASRTLVPEMAAEIRALRADLEELRLWLSVGCMPAETYRPGNEAVLKRVDAQLAEMRREAEELRLTLLNERGEGEPPVAGWTFTDCGGWGMCWVFGGGADKWIAVTPKPAVGWYVRLGSAHIALHAQIGRISYPTARAAMRAASAAGGSDA